MLDNPGSHKGRQACQAVRAAGAPLLFLPPDSPDLNPIEMLFAKLKTLFRTAGRPTADRPTIEEAWREVASLLPSLRRSDAWEKRRTRMEAWATYLTPSQAKWSFSSARPTMLDHRRPRGGFGKALASFAGAATRSPASLRHSSFRRMSKTSYSRSASRLASSAETFRRLEGLPDSDWRAAGREDFARPP